MATTVNPDFVVEIHYKKNKSLNYIASDMLTLQKIIITHFKNYDITGFDFSKSVVGICGRNGIGKTNLLDAIYYCCFTKSYFAGTDTLNTGIGKDGFRLEASFLSNEVNQKVVCIHKSSAKKEFLINDVAYEKLSKHIGLFPCVMIAPDDIDMINGGSESRRKFMDTVLCQLDKDYLQQLIIYNKVLQQRNGLLKRSAEQGKLDLPLLEIFDEQLIGPANFVYKKRVEFTSQLIPLVHQFYVKIAEANEEVKIIYESKLHETSIDNLLINSREKDRLLQRTNVGIHKDDIIFELSNQPFKNIASQGQKKSLLFALKLAEYQIIKTTKGFSPILLLDDVFEKLDQIRMDNLLHHVCIENNGQVFITDTHRSRLENAFEKLGISSQIIEL